MTEPISDEQLETLRKIMNLPIEEAADLVEDELDNDDMGLGQVVGQFENR